MIEDQGTRSERASWSQGAECVCQMSGASLGES